MKSLDKIMDKFSIRIIAMIVVISFISFSLGVLADNGNNSSSIPTIIEAGSGVETASYIIYKDGDYTCAKNGTTGRIDVRNENSSFTIQSAIDALQPNGGSVYISSGTYEIPYTIFIQTNNTILFGAGGSTYLTLDNSVKAPVIQIGYGDNDNEGVIEVSSISVSHLKINGNYLNNVYDSALPTAPYGIFLNHATNCVVSYCHVTNAYSDGIIASHDCSDLIISNNVAEGSYSGITVDKQTRNVVIDSNIAYSRAETGIVTFDVFNVTISNNVCHEIVMETTNQTTVTGNSIYKSGVTSDYGICLKSRCTDVVISNNVIYSVNLIGINVYGIAPDGTPEIIINVAITGNVINCNSNTQHGIWVQRVGNGIIIDGNYINFPSRSGITCMGSAIITNNWINRTGMQGIVVSGANSIVSSNHIYRASSFYGNTYSGITLNGTATGCSVSSNVIFSDFYNKPKYCIEEVSGAGDNLINDNVLTGYGTAAVLVFSASTKAINNLGFLTANKGTATIVGGGTSVVVNHGLAATPTMVIVTGNHSEVSACFVTSITATQFTINIASATSMNRVVYWYAAVYV